MSIVSLSAQNAPDTSQRSLREDRHEPEPANVRRQPDFRSLLEQARSRQEPLMSPRSVRERFGQDAVREYKSASIDVYRRIQELS